MIGTLATSHTVLNPTLRASALADAGRGGARAGGRASGRGTQRHSPATAARSTQFSAQLQGKFFSNNSLTATTLKKDLAKRHAVKLKIKRENMERTVEEYNAKLEEQRKLLILKRKREKKRQEKRMMMMEVLTKGCTLIQAVWRGHFVREYVKKRQEASRRIQPTVRRWSARRRKYRENLDKEFAKQRFQEAAISAAAQLLQRNYRKYRTRVAKLRAVVVVQRKIRKAIQNRTTFRIIGMIARWRRSVSARRIQRCFTHFRRLRQLMQYERDVLEAARRKREADAAKRNNLRRDFQRRRHLLINKIYRESALSLLERLMEPRGVNLNMEFRADGANIERPSSKKEESHEDNMAFVASATSLHARIQKQRHSRRQKKKVPKRPKPKPPSTATTPRDKPDWNAHFMRPSSSHRKLPDSRPSSRSSLRSRDGSGSRPGTSSSNRPRSPVSRPSTRQGPSLGRNGHSRTGPSSRASQRSRPISRGHTSRSGRRRKSRNIRSRDSQRGSRPQSRTGTPHGERSRPSSSTSARRPKSRSNSARSRAKPKKSKKRPKRQFSAKIPSDVIAKLSSKSQIGNLTAAQLAKPTKSSRSALPNPHEATSIENDSELGSSTMLHLGQAELLILDRVTSNDRLPSVPNSGRGRATQMNDNDDELHMDRDMDDDNSVAGMPSEYFASMYLKAQSATAAARERQARINGTQNHQPLPRMKATKRTSKPKLPQSSSRTRSSHPGLPRL